MLMLLIRIVHGRSQKSSRSEGVVLRRYLVGKELVQDGYLLHDIIAHLGNLGEEEEGEEAGNTTETGCEDAAGQG